MDSQSTTTALRFPRKQGRVKGALESVSVIQVTVVFSINTGVRPAVPVDKYKGANIKKCVKCTNLEIDGLFQDRSETLQVCWTRICSDPRPSRVFAGTNPYLTFHCSSQGTVLIDLAPDDKEFQSVEEEV